MIRGTYSLIIRIRFLLNHINDNLIIIDHIELPLQNLPYFPLNLISNKPESHFYEISDPTGIFRLPIIDQYSHR